MSISYPVDYLNRFQQHAGLITWRDTEFSEVQLASDISRILHVAALLEEDTVITVKHAHTLGLTRAPDIREFLPQWDKEEAEHGHALRCLLANQTYDPPEPTRHTISMRRRVVSKLPAQPLSIFPHTSYLFCVLGAAAEYVATVMYGELAKNSPPVVSNLLKLIARQEARHFHFFLIAAKQRGQKMSTRNGLIAARLLSKMWTPIGVSTLGLDVWNQIFSAWLNDLEIRRRLVMMDRVLDSVPHLNGLHLMQRFLDENLG